MQIRADSRAFSAFIVALVFFFGAALLVFTEPLRAVALVLPNGHSKVCFANSADHNLANPDGTVPEVLAAPNSLGAFARTSFPPLGPLRMAFDLWLINQTIFKAFGPSPNPATVEIVYELNAYHECAHARLHLVNEFYANCEAIREMRLFGLETPANEPILALYHQSFGQIGAQYGNSGVAFWAGTMQCVNSLPPLQPGGPNEDVPPK